MANPAFMSIQGSTQGNITAGAGSEESVGNMAINDHKDESRVIKLDHNVFIPKDPHSGMATGQRVHEAINLTKLVDKASPLLYNALATNEVLDEVILSYYRQSATGMIELFMKQTLKQAQISAMRHMLPDVLNKDMEHYGQIEEVSISYATIILEHVTGGTVYEDKFREVGV